MSKLKKGITLIELSVVLLISIIVLSVGATFFIPIEQRQLSQAARELKNEIRYIQRMALSEKTEYRLVFDWESKGYYSILKREGGVDKLVRDTYFPSGVALINTNAKYRTINFTQKGTIDMACTIILASTNYNVAITCAVGTGNVSIKEIRPRSELYSLNEF